MRPSLVAETFQKMAESELALGRRKEANVSFRKSINLYEKLGPEGVQQMAFVCLRLADSLQQVPDSKEAENMYERVAVICKQRRANRELCNTCADHHDSVLKRLGDFEKPVYDLL